MTEREEFLESLRTILVPDRPTALPQTFECPHAGIYGYRIQGLGSMAVFVNRREIQVHRVENQWEVTVLIGSVELKKGDRISVVGSMVKSHFQAEPR